MGLRIAAGVAQGLGLAGSVRVKAISSLDALAIAAYEDYVAFAKGTTDLGVIATIDSKPDEVYWGYYEIKGARDEIELRRLIDPSLARADSFDPNLIKPIRKPVIVIGNEYPEVITTGFKECDKISVHSVPSASFLIKAAQARTDIKECDPEELSPIYLHSGIRE